MRTRLRAFASQAILEAAEEVFAEQGLQAGMDAIASRAGVAVGTLYKHFSDRDGLVQALLDARFQELLTAIDRAREATAHVCFEEQLGSVLHVITEVTKLHAAFRRVTLQAELPPCHPRRVALRAAVVERLDVVLQRGRAEGLLGADPDLLQPVLLLGLLHSTLVLSPRAAAQTSEEVARLVTRQFLYGAAAR